MLHAPVKRERASQEEGHAAMGRYGLGIAARDRAAPVGPAELTRLREEPEAAPRWRPRHGAVAQVACDLGKPLVQLGS